MIESRIAIIRFISEEGLSSIKNATAAIPGKTGVRINSSEMLDTLQEHDFGVDFDRRVVRLTKKKLNKHLARANGR